MPSADPATRNDSISDRGSAVNSFTEQARDPVKAKRAALAWLDSVGVSPRAQRVGRALAWHASVMRYGMGWRKLRAGDVACYVSAETLAENIGRSVRTVKYGLVELVEAGLIRHRTARTNTYIFPSPCTPLCTPLCTPKERSEEVQRKVTPLPVRPTRKQRELLTVLQEQVPPGTWPDVDPAALTREQAREVIRQRLALRNEWRAANRVRMERNERANMASKAAERMGTRSDGAVSVANAVQAALGFHVSMTEAEAQAAEAERERKERGREYFERQIALGLPVPPNWRERVT